MNNKFKIILNKMLFLTFTIPYTIAMGGMASMVDPSQRPLLNQQVSVHEMFKDLTEDEIVQLMEEGQQYIKYIEEQASPEEKLAFQKMMQDTLQNFTEDDFAEIEKIVKVVEPILTEKESAPSKYEPIKEEVVKKEESKTIISGDSSLEYTLHRIHKTINGIILKAKSDPKLAEMFNTWQKKNDFNQMVRLLQSLNKKDLIAKLTAGKTEDVKKLFDTIENFNKRLEIENKQFTVADTFGLEVDQKTSAENVKKFTKIIEFFSGATETLLPMVIKFLQDYEPEALKIAKSIDDQAKSSLDAAKQIEKMKKPIERPIGEYRQQSKVPYSGSYNQQSHYTPHNYYGHDEPTMSRRERNKMNAEQGVTQPSMPVTKSTPIEKTKTEAEKEKEATEKKDKEAKATKSLNDVITKIEQYDDMFDNNAFRDYSTTLNYASKMYDSFGKELTLNSNDMDMITNPKKYGPLTKDQIKLQSQYQDKLNQFNKNIKIAGTHFASLKDAIENIKPHISEIKAVAEATRASLNNLSLQDLSKLETSPALKKLRARFNSYETLFKNLQKELRDRHEKHLLATADDKEIAAYHELKSKAENLHGLEKTMSDTKASLDLLDRAMKAEIKRKKRNASK